MEVKLICENFEKSEMSENLINHLKTQSKSNYIYFDENIPDFKVEITKVETGVGYSRFTNSTTVESKTIYIKKID